LEDRPRPGAAPKLSDSQCAHIIALACTPAPERHAHWTLRLLADQVVQLGYAESFSYEGIRRLLKKHPETLAGSEVVHIGVHKAPARVYEGYAARGYFCGHDRRSQKVVKKREKAGSRREKFSHGEKQKTSQYETRRTTRKSSKVKSFFIPSKFPAKPRRCEARRGNPVGASLVLAPTVF
jgi:hypothetical protein